MLIVIEGVVLPERRKFRPSDWAEMLIEGAGLAHFGPNHKIHYEDDVEPATIGGCASIIFDEALEQSHPEAYAELLHCHGSAIWRQNGVGIMAPLQGRRNGASPGSA